MSQGFPNPFKTNPIGRFNNTLGSFKGGQQNGNSGLADRYAHTAENGSRPMFKKNHMMNDSEGMKTRSNSNVPNV